MCVLWFSYYCVACLSSLSNMAARHPTWIFNFKLVKLKIKNSVLHFHQPHFRSSVGICGQWPLNGTAQIVNIFTFFAESSFKQYCDIVHASYSNLYVFRLHISYMLPHSECRTHANTLSPGALYGYQTRHTVIFNQICQDGGESQ